MNKFIGFVVFVNLTSSIGNIFDPHMNIGVISSIWLMISAGLFGAFIGHICDVLEKE
jgi:hypothetical protein